MYAEASGDFNGGAVGSIQTGVAVANPSPTAATVNFELTTLAGASLGVSGSTQVPPQGHIAVQVADLDRALATLEAAGFAHEPRQEHWGARRHYAHAPGGHLVEVFATAPTGAT